MQLIIESQKVKFVIFIILLFNEQTLITVILLVVIRLSKYKFSTSKGVLEMVHCTNLYFF